MTSSDSLSLDLYPPTHTRTIILCIAISHAGDMMAALFAVDLYQLRCDIKFNMNKTRL